MNQQIRISIDLDDVLSCFNEHWISLYNEKSGDNLTVDKITDWNLSQFVLPEWKDRIFSKEIVYSKDFFLNVPVKEYAVDFMNTYYLVADSTEYFRISLFNSETNEPIDLAAVDNIEWFIGSASVKNRYSEVEKSLLRDEIKILRDNFGEYTNVIQIALLGEDTKNLQGGYIHQLLITDGDGKRFRPLQGLLVFSSALLSAQ